MKQWQILARHKWIAGATIAESMRVDSREPIHRFTATIRGYGNWRIWQGRVDIAPTMEERAEMVKSRVRAIRDRIDAGDETVFDEPGAF